MESNLWWLTAKTSRQDDNLWLPLAWHLKDTAEVMRYLLHHWVPNAFYTEIGFTDKESARKIAIFLAAIHDSGKGCPVFQSRITRNLPDIRDTLFDQNLYFKDQYQNEKDLKHAHMGAVLLRSMGVPDSVAVVVGAHHGKPETNTMSLRSPKSEMLVNKSAYGAQSEEWKSVQQMIVKEALEEAGYQSTEELPELSEEAQMLFAGLLIMADWIASNSIYFPLISTDTLPMDYDRSRTENGLSKLHLPEPYMVSDYWKDPGFFRERFGFEPNAIQQAMIHKAEEMESPGLMILEAPMGEGKTEAALAAAEILMNRFELGGIAFFLPSQATSNAMLDRILEWIQSQPDADQVSLELSHSNANLNHTFRELREGCVQTQEDESELFQKAAVYSFFDGSKTKLLANVVVGTVDQLLMAALRQKHVMLRQLGLMGKIVVIDECHAYDAYMCVYLKRILRWLSAYGIPVILLSATLPGKRRAELVDAYGCCRKKDRKEIEEKGGYPLLTTAEAWFQPKDLSGNFQACEISYDKQPRDVWVERRSENEAFCEIKAALDAGGCVGIILNTVRRVQEWAELLKKKFPEANLYVDHSYFLLPDRMEREQVILQKVGKASTWKDREKTVILGTQVLEQSLNLDFDLLITDLCPMDLLMQRIGREHRHLRERPEGLLLAKCIVLKSDPEQLEDGAKAIYGEYLLRRTAMLLPEKITLPQDISKLVQYVYNEKEGYKFLPDQYESYKNQRLDQEEKAEGYCLREPDADPLAEPITGLLDAEPFYQSEEKARATVRDGEDSIEVIVVQESGNDFVLILSGEHSGEKIDMSRQPSMKETEILEEQRIKLPLRLSKARNYEENIEILIEAMKRNIPEWMNHPALMDELIMILDENANFNFGNQTLHYDPQMGLQWKEKT